MSEQLNPVIVQRTQQKLGKFIQRPQLTEKLLKRPPFRFLHDIVTTAIKQYGVLDATFSAQELVSENIKEKDDKVAFLQKLISKLNSELGIALKVKPSKIVAGTEADKTNELLQALGSLIEKKQSRQKPPPPNRTQTNGDSAAHTKENKAATNAPSNQAQANKKLVSEDLRNSNSKTVLKNEPASRQTNSKENGSSVTPQPAQERLTNDKTIKQTNLIDNDSRDATVKTQQNSKNTVNRHQTNGTKLNKDSPKTQKPLPMKASGNDRPQNRDYVDVVSIPTEDPNIDRDPLLKNGESEPRRFIGTKKGSRDQLFNGMRNELRPVALDFSSSAIVDDTEDLITDSKGHPSQEKKENTDSGSGNFLSFNGKGTEAGKLSPPVSAMNNAFEKPIPDRSTSPAPQSKRPPSGTNRPKSSRRPPSRAIRDRLSVMRQDSRPVSSQVPRVIIEGKSLSDDEEDRIVESAVFDQSVVDFSIGAGSELLSGQQGKLVEQILSAQKDVDSNSDMDGGTREIGMTNQFQQLKAIIQEMAKVALPLGHLIPLIHEDMETMQHEWAFWKKEADVLEEEYNKEKATPLTGSDKLKAELEQLDKTLAEQEAKLCAAKAAVLKGEKDVSLVMANFGKNR